MQIATYVDGRTVDYDEPSRVFSIGGIPVTVEQVISYDRASQLAWFSGDLRNWVYQFGAATNPAPVRVVRPVTPGKGLVVAGGILAAFGVLVCIVSTPGLVQDGVAFGVLLAAIGLYIQAVGVLRPRKMGWRGMTALGVLLCFFAYGGFFDFYYFLYYLGTWPRYLSPASLGAGVLLAAIGLTMQFVSEARPHKLTGGIVTALGVLTCAIALVPGAPSGLVVLGVLLAAIGFAMHVVGEVGYGRVSGQIFVALGLLMVIGSSGFPALGIRIAGSGLGMVLAVVGFIRQVKGTSSSPQPV